MSHAPSRAVIDLTAYLNNLRAIQRMAPNGCQLMPVIKANAYGHGAIPIAKKALEAGAAMFAVATVDEGAALREAGIETPILVTVPPEPGQAGALVEYGLQVMLSCRKIAERIGELARRANRIVGVHVKVDTGMGRQGFEPETLFDELRAITRISNIDIAGIATHFPNADISGDTFAVDQLKLFRKCLARIDKEGVPYEFIHAANSAGIVNVPGSHFDLVRPGLLTYGVWPTDMPPRGRPVQPVMRWETNIILVRDIAQGHTVGYGRTFTAPQSMRLAVLPVGYADGYPHACGNRAEVLIRGQRCAVAGAVSMDQITVDVSHLPRLDTGERATLLGRDGQQEITVRELAAWADTIPYVILTGIGPRVERIYFDGDTPSAEASDGP